MQGRRYTDEEKRAALEAVNLCAGNVAEAARLIGFPEFTIREWARGNCVSESVFKDYTDKKSGLIAAKFRALLDRVVNAMASDEKIENARLIELNTVAGTIFDKLRLVDNAPTAITSHRDEAAIAKLRADAEALIARILPHYGGDRAAALAAIRENAPALSEYIN